VDGRLRWWNNGDRTGTVNEDRRDEACSGLVIRLVVWLRGWWEKGRDDADEDGGEDV
jgi:hypothetical protein